MTSSQIEGVLGLLDRELWIVTTADRGRRGGLAATWVASASIDPNRPVLLAGIAPNHFTAELIDASRAFTAHLLREEQTAMAWNFARDSGRSRDKLAGLTSGSTPAGAPILDDCLAWCDCRVLARHDAGDRLFYWADVAAAQLQSAGRPMREQAFLASLAPDQRRELAASRQADLAVQRPMHERWRRQLANLNPPPES